MGVTWGDKKSELSDFRDYFQDWLERDDGGDFPEQGSADFLSVPELVVAIARPQGTAASEVREGIETQFRKRKYLISPISLAGLLREAYLELESPNTTDYQEKSGFERIRDLMAMGDMLRGIVRRSAVAELGVLEIGRRRARDQEVAREKQAAGIVYVLSSLVHPAEVSLLRSVYRQRFFLVGIHQPYEIRLDRLSREFQDVGDKEHLQHAIEILEIDAGLRPSGSSISDASLNINATFHKADLFLLSQPRTTTHDVAYPRYIERWLNQLFSCPYGAPSLDEYGMANAFLAARQSVALGRSVGAAILDEDGEVVALGWNEPPHPGGGVSREGFRPDLREHLDGGEDSSDVYRMKAIAEFLHRVTDSESDSEFENLFEQGVEGSWIKEFRKATKYLSQPRVEDVRVLAAIRSLSSVRMLNLIEFGRSVHAEMAAITSAARRGIRIKDATLYVTTYPCHECARNVLSAGIKRVIYVEPYGKSMSDDLYKNAIRFASRERQVSGDDDRIPFEQFQGIAPSVQELLFSPVKRKHSLQNVAMDPSLEVGKTVSWTDADSVLRPSIRGYLDIPTDRAVAEGSDSDPLFEIARIYAEKSVSRQLLAQLRNVYNHNKEQSDEER